MKIEYQFRPTNHWNYITIDAYVILSKHYDSDRLRVVTEDE